MDRTHTWLYFNSFLNSDNSSRRTATKDVLYYSLSKRNIESFTFNHSQWQKNCSTFLFLLLTSLAIRIQSTNMFLFQWECLSKRASPSECVAVNLLISFFFFFIPNAPHTSRYCRSSRVLSIPSRHNYFKAARILAERVHVQCKRCVVDMYSVEV